MENARQQRIWRIFRRRVVILVLLAAAVLLVPAVWSAWDKERETQKNRDIAEEQLSQQQGRLEALQAEVESLKTDRGAEEALRHRFTVGAEGEGVVYVVDHAVEPVEEDDSQGGIFGWFQSIWPF